MMNKHSLVLLLYLLLLLGLLTACNEVDTKITAVQDGMETREEKEIETITSDDLGKISRPARRHLACLSFWFLSG